MLNVKIIKRYVKSGDAYKHMRRRYDINLSHGRDARYVDMERVWASGYDPKQMTIDHKFKAPYLYPEDDPRYKSPQELQSRSRLKQLEKAGDTATIMKEYPTFANWRDSWRHNYHESAMPAKENDDSVIMDFERAEEKYNQDLACYLRFLDPVDDKLFLDRDQWRNRLYGVQSMEPEDEQEREKLRAFIQDGEAPETRKNMMKDCENIEQVYAEPFYNTDALESEKVRGNMRRYRNKAISSKANHAMKTSQSGEANYDWRAVWPTHSSFRDPLVPFDVRQGARQETRTRPTKWNNTQMNFSPNLLHLTPPAVKAHCEQLKQFGTAFPKEYKADYAQMRHDYPIEIHTTSTCSAVPAQGSPNHQHRWASLYVQMNQLNLDFTGRAKMEIFVNGRVNEGVQRRLKHYGNPGKRQGRYITRRDLTQQQYRFGEDYYNRESDMIRLESGRCPLKAQNEEYLVHLLSSYWRDSARVLKFENKGELEYGQFNYDKSRVKRQLSDLLDKTGAQIDAETEEKLGSAIETLHNAVPHGHKIRGQQGWERDANLDRGYHTCPRAAAMTDYAESMRKVLLNEDQQAFKFNPTPPRYKKKPIYAD